MGKPYLLDDIAEDIGRFCARYGRIPVTQTKEKFGTIRVYCGFGCVSLHNLLFPRYVYKHKSFPGWLWRLDCTHGGKFWGFISRIIFPYQKFIYKLAYMRAIWRYPHLFDAITSCMDYPEYVGFEIPTLCSKHSAEKRFNRAYLGDESSCNVCKDPNYSEF